MLSGARRGEGTQPANGVSRGHPVPVEFVTDAGTLSFFSTTTVFGTPIDITLSEIAIEGSSRRTPEPPRLCGRWRRTERSAAGRR